MTQVAVTFILGVVAIATFMLKGKQWPTFITAGLFGIFLGATPLGAGLMDLINRFFDSLNGWLS